MTREEWDTATRGNFYCLTCNKWMGSHDANNGDDVKIVTNGHIVVTTYKGYLKAIPRAVLQRLKGE